MIEENDVEILIKAKRERRTIDVLMVLSAIPLAILVLLELFNVDHGYTTLLAITSVLLISGAMGQSRWISVSRDQLIQTLERIVSKDPNAVKMLAEKGRNNGTAQKST